MKKPPRKIGTRKSPDQLRSSVWPDRESAVADLRRSSMPVHGDDYELAEYRPGSWQLVPRGEAEPEPIRGERGPEPIREEAVIASLRKQPGKPPRGAAVVVAEARPVKQKGRGADKANVNGHATPQADAEADPDEALAAVKRPESGLFTDEPEPEAKPPVDFKTIAVRDAVLTVL